jgi:HEAT repeat protein
MPDPHRFCAACGKDLVPNGSFCPYCGVKVGQTAPTHQGRTVDDWLEDLVSHNGGAREKAIAALQALGPKADDAITRLFAALKDPDPPGLPAEALLQLGRHTDLAVASILKGLSQHESMDVRMTNLGSLMKCGERAAPAAPGLRKILRDASRGSAAYPDVAENAARALGWIGPAASDAVDELLDALKHQDPKVR